MNLATIANSQAYRDLTGDQDLMRRAARRFCQVHPVATYSGAILDLYVSLPLRKTDAK